MNSLLIKNKSPYALTLNESFDSSGKKKYEFTGPFTPCDGTTKNRNGRIYDENTVLPHLAYLRDEIKKKGCILGELDHPDNRFEVSLKQVSHKITDLWFDEDKKMIMGKLELLDTPNGKTMKAIVDAGCPLFVSSRAAGSVLPNSHVSIQQIFTYDIVSSPGFEQCELNRVNESMRPKITSFLNESISLLKKSKENNIAVKFGIIDENTQIMKTNKSPEITFHKINESKKSLATPILKEDVKIKLSPEGKEKFMAQTATPENNTPEDNMQPNIPDNNNIPPMEDKHDPNEILTIKPVYTQKNDIEGIQPNFGTEYKTNNDNPITEELKNNLFVKKTNLMLKQHKKSKNENLQEPIITDKNTKSEIVKTADDGSDEDTYNKNKDISEKGKKDEKTKTVKKEEICPYCGNPISKCTCAKKVEGIKKDVDEGTKLIMNKYDSLIETINKKANIKNSIIKKYPFATSLDENNFYKFSQLIDNDKKACAEWIWNNQIFNPRQINEQWMTPLTERKKLQKNYLKLADKEDIDLYNKSPENVRKSIDETAKCYILNDKSDVDEFWLRTGIREQYSDAMHQQEFVENFNNSINKTQTSDNENGILGMKTIKLVESLMQGIE